MRKTMISGDYLNSCDAGHQSSSVFFGKDYCVALKGLCAIPVVLVHIPAQYGNVLQDAIGSFAYVAVTIFFLISAYGMNSSLDTSSDYLKKFWKRRLSRLLIPCLVVNFLSFLTNYLIDGTPKPKFLYDVNDYVLVLLEYCLVFYILSLLKCRRKDLIVAILVIGSSLYLYFTNDGVKPTQWCYERFGLIWGLILYRRKDDLCRFMSKNKLAFVLCAAILSLMLGILYLKFKNVWFFGGYLLKIILGLSIILTLFGMTFRLDIDLLRQKVLVFLGKISYEVYLLHMTIIALLSAFDIRWQSHLFVALTLAMTMLVSCFIHELDERLIRLFRNGH